MLEQFYLVMVNDGTHLVSLDNMNVDFLTKQEISEKKISLCQFKDSYVFWNIYLEKRDNFVVSSKELKNLLDKWNGKLYFSPNVLVKQEMDKYKNFHS